MWKIQMDSHVFVHVHRIYMRENIIKSKHKTDSSEIYMNKNQ